MARILLAAEDALLRRYLARVLGRRGHGIWPVAAPRRALALLWPDAFDLLIAQQPMADIDGPELARRAAAAVPGLRVLFLCGFRVLPLKQGALPAMDEAVLEPAFHLGRLAGEIDRMLAGRARQGKGRWP